MTNSLNIDVYHFSDLEHDIENAFGFRVDWPSEYPTVGELHRQLVARFKGRGRGKCATAMAYFRLRKQLRTEGIKDLKPSLDLTAISAMPFDWLKALEKDTGLRMPKTDPAAMSGWGCLIGIIALLSLIFLHRTYVDFAIVGAGVVAAAVLLALGRESLPKGCRTLGGLAGRAAALNFAVLVGQGAHPGEREIWSAMLALALVYSEVRREEITAATLLKKLR